MNRIHLFILLTLITSTFYSQCRSLSERDYQLVKMRVSQSAGGYNTFQTAMDVARSTCFTSNQARDLANLLANDRDKLDFLTQVFPGILDKDNFTSVMDAFRNMSSAFRLYHITLGAAQSTGFSPPTSQNPNCQRTMESARLAQLTQQVNAAPDDRAKASAILTTVNACIYVQQAVALVSTIRDENIRLDVLKRLSPFIYDIENYTQAGSILSSNLRTQFLAYLQNPQGNSATNTTTEIDFEEFLKAIRSQSFDKDKVSYVKTYMKNAYLNTDQIKKIIKEISFDASRLDVAKFLFTNCVDKPNYYQVSEIFSFSSSKTELNDFVRSKL